MASVHSQLGHKRWCTNPERADHSDGNDRTADTEIRKEEKEKEEEDHTHQKNKGTQVWDFSVSHLHLLLPLFLSFSCCCWPTPTFSLSQCGCIRNAWGFGVSQNWVATSLIQEDDDDEEREREKGRKDVLCLLLGPLSSALTFRSPRVTDSISPTRGWMRCNKKKEDAAPQPKKKKKKREASFHRHTHALSVCTHNRQFYKGHLSVSVILAALTAAEFFGCFAFSSQFKRNEPPSFSSLSPLLRGKCQQTHRRGPFLLWRSIQRQPRVIYCGGIDFQSICPLFFFLISKKCLTKRRRKVISNNLRNPPCSCPLNSSQGRKNERKKTLINPARSIKPSSHCADRLMPTNRQDTIEGAHVQRKVQQEKVLSTSSYCNFLNRRRWSMIPCTKEAKEES